MISIGIKVLSRGIISPDSNVQQHIDQGETNGFVFYATDISVSDTNKEYLPGGEILLYNQKINLYALGEITEVLTIKPIDYAENTADFCANEPEKKLYFQVRNLHIIDISDIKDRLYIDKTGKVKGNLENHLKELRPRSFYFK